MKGMEGVFKGSGSHQAPHFAYTHRTMSPAMAAMLPKVTSEAHAGKLTPIYTVWAPMMHRQSPQSRFSGLWRRLFSGCQKPMLQSRFVVLTGRMRVGKTCLVYRLREFRICIVIRDNPKNTLKIFAYEI